MHLPPTRQLFFLAFLGCAGLIAMALYLEHVVGLIPCPLCHVQRFAVVLFGLICLLASVHNPARLGQRLYAVLAMLAAAFGIATAGRQIWLQGLPEDQLPACLPPLEFMIEAFPLQDIISKMLHGTADCAKVDWTLLGFSIAELSIVSFAAMFVFATFLLIRKNSGINSGTAH
ncbi:MAG: disulfide bond formation protein B [Pseudomonas sp.]|jgi:disulfide bond formation protein DsbB|nr:disulfide bond formation protein B [Pseudomonas sp.]MDD2223238.1 disulfide bond formation protein B [Pseudomonas sp.]MDY0413836.1 disulfide bond formation protein B [Pseudomonas sp.]NLO52966.1 disulfide bond formation protein B [Gammaproteobacteria bacterium]